MSEERELKAMHAFDVYEEYTKTGNDDAAQVYRKSEADKLIKDIVEGAILMFRKSSCCRGFDLKSSLGKIANAAFKHWNRIEYIESNARQLRLDKIEYALNIRHQKYKRCLAMTDKCGQAVSRYLAEGRLYEIDAMTAEGERHNELLEQVKDCDKAVLFYDRWYHRWSKIAEQCKC